jgi:hypothetical protein
MRFSRSLPRISRSPVTADGALLLLLVIILFASPAVGTQATQLPVAKITLDDLISVRDLGEPVLSPDGTQFAIVRDGQIDLLPVGGGWPVTLTTTPGAKTEVSWSPDSKNLAFISQGSVWVVPA